MCIGLCNFCRKLDVLKLLFKFLQKDKKEDYLQIVIIKIEVEFLNKNMTRKMSKRRRKKLRRNLLKHKIKRFFKNYCYLLLKIFVILILVVSSLVILLFGYWIHSIIFFIIGLALIIVFYILRKKGIY